MPTRAISAADNVSVSLVTATVGFFASNWPQILLVTFSAVHAFIAIDKYLYERKQRT